MPNETDQPTQQLILVDQQGLGRIHVGMEAFFDYSFWLAEELEDLVALWQHKAAPGAKHLSEQGNDRF